MEKTELPPFSVANAERWQDLLTTLGDDPYGSWVLRLAAGWANRMEREIAGGKAVAECAESAAIEADKALGGTPDFVYGYAMETLCDVWAHGPELAKAYGAYR